jgi:apolipoprotein D and lipocalin family protein
MGLLFKNLSILILMGILFLGCAHGRQGFIPELQVVPHVDLQKYLGTWYEIARFPHRFQEGCVGTTAEYTLLENGKIGVLNQCRKETLDGKITSAKGEAWVVDKLTNAKLKVSFFWPFSGDYWIIDLDENYEYAVVGHPGRNYLWILSRSPQMDEASYKRILDRLIQQSYDITRLIQTPQAQQP